MHDAMNQRHSYVSIFSVTIKTGELPSDVKRKIILTGSLKLSNASSSVITVRIGYLLMRDSQLVTASKYNPCLNILSEGCVVCFHKPGTTHLFTLVRLNVGYIS